MKHTPERERDSQSGFTMVELLVTLGVTVFGLMGVLSLHTSLSTGANLAGQSQEAVAVGAQVMETLRSKRPAALCDEVMNGTASVPCTNTTYTTVLGRNSMSYAVSVDVSVAATNLWLVRVEVSWTDDQSGDSHMVPLELLRTSQEAL
jgi:Tfp pilus assembly protein PilV